MSVEEQPEWTPNRSGRFVKRKNLLSLSGIEPQILGIQHVALVNIDYTIPVPEV
jgi:hypothetical protein